jgi:hypothetical protein
MLNKSMEEYTKNTMIILSIKIEFDRNFDRSDRYIDRFSFLFDWTFI